MQPRWTRTTILAGVLTAATAISHLACQAQNAPVAPPRADPPLAVTLGTAAPEGAIRLITTQQADIGKNWYRRYSKEDAGWTVNAEGIAHPTDKNDMTSKQAFGDLFLHAEFRCPVDASGKPVTGGNSGIGFQGRYEVQIFGSYGHKADKHECGALYDEKPPMLIASKPAGQWQTFDIIFRAPRFDAAGKRVENARATVFQNGILVQDNEEFTGPTGIQYGENAGEVPVGPLILQGNHDPVDFRNVWVLPL